MAGGVLLCHVGNNEGQEGKQEEPDSTQDDTAMLQVPGPQAGRIKITLNMKPRLWLWTLTGDTIGIRMKLWDSISLSHLLTGGTV